MDEEAEIAAMDEQAVAEEMYALEVSWGPRPTTEEVEEAEWILQEHEKQRAAAVEAVAQWRSTINVPEDFFENLKNLKTSTLKHNEIAEEENLLKYRKIISAADLFNKLDLTEARMKKELRGDILGPLAMPAYAFPRDDNTNQFYLVLHGLRNEIIQRNQEVVNAGDEAGNAPPEV